VFSVFAGSIIATNPAHTYGAVDIVITTPKGTATGTSIFTYGADPPVPAVFSVIKRIFGESVKSTSIQGMYHEVMQKY
jgi:hypothetical protein